MSPKFKANATPTEIDGKSLSAEVISNLILNSPVAQALALIGDRWAFLIIRDIYQGARQFEELLRLSGAARGTLTSRLKRLVEGGILYRNPYRDAPVRYEYRLTDKGLDLYPVVLNVWEWETKWGKGEHIPLELIHSTCGKTMHPIYRCKHCHAKARIEEFRFRAGKDRSPAKKVPPRFQRRSKSRGQVDSQVDQRFFHYLDVIGDRWTSLVVAAAFFGLQRHDQILEAIGIATNILSDRLKLLIDAGVLVKLKYQDKPARHEYHLTDKGRDLYAPTLAMHEWGSRWLIRDKESSLVLHHQVCDQSFESEIVCSECDGRVVPSDIAYGASDAD